jgi:hypothetical protein
MEPRKSFTAVIQAENHGAYARLCEAGRQLVFYSDESDIKPALGLGN